MEISLFVWVRVYVCNTISISSQMATSKFATKNWKKNYIIFFSGKEKKPTVYIFFKCQMKSRQRLLTTTLVLISVNIYCVRTLCIGHKKQTCAASCIKTCSILCISRLMKNNSSHHCVTCLFLSLSKRIQTESEKLYRWEGTWANASFPMLSKIYLN